MEEEEEKEERPQPQRTPHAVLYTIVDIERPHGVPPTEHFRMIELFKTLDPDCTGWAPWTAIDKELKDHFKREFRSEANATIFRHELHEELEKSGGEYLEIYACLRALGKAQTKLKAKLDAKRGEIAEQRKRLHLEQDELQVEGGRVVFEFEKMNCAERSWFDLKTWLRRTKASTRYGIIPIWRPWFTQIEAVFGGNVTSYFLFAQYVFWLNVGISVIYLPILIPGFFFQTTSTITNWVGLILGSGMENSVLFAGYYSRLYWQHYRMDLWWLLATVLMMLFSAVVIFSSMHERFDLHREDQKKLKFCNLVFGQFDWNLKHEHAIKLHQAALETQLKAMVLEREELESFKEKLRNTPNYLTKLKVRRAAGWTLSVLFGFGTAGFVGWLIYNEQLIVPTVQKHPSLHYFATIVVPSLISFFKAISPGVMGAFVKLEKYSRAKDAFRALFVRIFVIRMFYVLVVLFNTIYKTVSNSSTACVETQVGLIYYRMLVVDLMVGFVTSIVVPMAKLFVLRFCCASRVKKELADKDIAVLKSHFSQLDKLKQEFQIPENIIDLMYFQSLVWSGSPYCPSLPLLAVLYAFCNVWIKVYHVQHLCRPPHKPMGIARQAHYFRSLLLLTLGVSMIPFSIYLRRTASCGPFQGTDPLTTLYSWVDGFPSYVSLPFAYSQSSVLLWIIIVLAAIYAFFTKKREQLLRDELGVLRRRLQVELKEKSTILREGHVELEQDRLRGRTLFYTWINELAEFGHLYAPKFQARGFDDLLQLVSLEERELYVLLPQLSTEEWRMPGTHIDFFVRQIARKRLELIPDH